MEKPFISAAENNKLPILARLRTLCPRNGCVLEVAAGTGQHAVCFAEAMPELHWQTSDLASSLPGIRQWIADSGLNNLPAPLELDVAAGPWPLTPVELVYTANSLHYMPWSAVMALFRAVSEVLTADGAFVVYGPFNYGGRSLSEGNRALDRWLYERDPAFAIRALEDLIALGANHGLRLRHDWALPANNRLLVWRRCPDRAAPL